MRSTRTVTRFSGFTLIELMLVLSIMSILTAIALPHLRTWIDRSVIDGASSSFRSALRLARSEAMSRSEVVSLCALDGSKPPDVFVCAAGGKDWSSGWMVFVDRDRRGEVNPGDLVLGIYQPGAGAPKIEATLRYISFQPNGVSLTAASHFVYLPTWAAPGDLSAPGALRLCLNKPGRARAVPAPVACA